MNRSMTRGTALLVLCLSLGAPEAEAVLAGATRAATRGVTSAATRTAARGATRAAPALSRLPANRGAAALRTAGNRFLNGNGGSRIAGASSVTAWTNTGTRIRVTARPGETLAQTLGRRLQPGQSIERISSATFRGADGSLVRVASNGARGGTTVTRLSGPSARTASTAAGRTAARGSATAGATTAGATTAGATTAGATTAGATTAGATTAGATTATAAASTTAATVARPGILRRTARVAGRAALWGAAGYGVWSLADDMQQAGQPNRNGGSPGSGYQGYNNGTGRGTGSSNTGFGSQRGPGNTGNGVIAQGPGNGTPGSGTPPIGSTPGAGTPSGVPGRPGVVKPTGTGVRTSSGTSITAGNGVFAGYNAPPTAFTGPPPGKK